MSGEHDVCPGCGAEAWCCSCVDLTDRCTTHHICPCLQAKLDAAEVRVTELEKTLNRTGARLDKLSTEIEDVLLYNRDVK